MGTEHVKVQVEVKNIRSRDDRLPGELAEYEHALYVWKDEDERWDVVERYIQATLDRGERATIVPYPAEVNDTLDRLREHEEWREEIRDSQITAMTPAELVPDDEPVTRERLRGRYRELLAQAREDGYRSLDLVVDLGAFIKEEVAASDLARIERANGRTFPFKVRLLCLLDRESASKIGVENLMRIVDSHTPGRVHVDRD